jgi:hypothetical protein
MALAFVLVSAGAFLLSGVDAGGSYATDVVPGTVLAGLGLGIALVSVALSVLTGAPAHETGMLSGLNTTGHEVGGSLGIAVLVSIATSSLAGSATPAALARGIGDAFVAAGIIAAAASIVALVVLPPAASFIPKLRAAPRIAVH